MSEVVVTLTYTVDYKDMQDVAQEINSTVTGNGSVIEHKANIKHINEVDLSDA